MHAWPWTIRAAPYGATKRTGNVMHKNYDNTGPDIPGLKKDFSPDADTVADAAVADMAAFDQLGPLTRSVITGMCVQLSALGVLQLIRQCYPGMHENQQVDREVALMLGLADREILKLINRTLETGAGTQFAGVPADIPITSPLLPAHERLKTGP